MRGCRSRRQGRIRTGKRDFSLSPLLRGEGRGEGRGTVVLRSPTFRVGKSWRRPVNSGYELNKVPCPLYLPIAQNVRCKRLGALAGGHRPKRAAMSPDAPPATTVGEPGIFAVVTHDRTVAGSRSHEQGRLP